MIRSSKHNLSYCSNQKINNIDNLIDDYRSLVQSIINYIWINGYQNFNISKNKLHCPTFIDSSFLKNFDSNLTERLKQCAGKQALAMISSSIKKREKQFFVLKKFQRIGKIQKALQRKISIFPLIKPNASNINIELDSRFVDFKFENQNKFLCFIKLSSFKRGEFIKVPITKTPIFDKWNSLGKLKGSIRISKNNVHLFFDVEDAEKKKDGQVIGCDQGIIDIVTLSDGQKPSLYQEHYSLSDVLKILSRKKKGSNSFKRTQKFRENLINWSINQLNFSNIKEVRLEKLCNVGKRKRRSRFLAHWAYLSIKDKLVRLSEEKGFLLKEVPNEFRSQRCSECGWVRKANRKGKTFSCRKCGNTLDADENAASNLLLDLYEVPYWVRLKKKNLLGFYWTIEGIYSENWEFIVP